ncbi:MAG: hypothetical protein HQM03_14820 [Magnetococcales bacterium]|nr:hypothetical protein [Magnetococcales bacterium]
MNRSIRWMVAVVIGCGLMFSFGAGLVAGAPDGIESPNPPKKKEKAKPQKAPAPSTPATRRSILPGDNRAKTSSLAKDGIHDPDSPAMSLLQDPSQALSAIPSGQWGEVDWMKAIREGVIKPFASLNGKGQMDVLDMDIILTNTKTMPHVRFPHESHTRWLACTNCHPDVFIAKKGENVMNMDSIFRGRFCGTCHGRVAFSVYICQRCHSIPHENSPPKWW